MERKRRAMSHEKASFVKLQGHKNAVEFAHLIGLKDDYKNDLQAKKDVIDLNGDGHSVKSGNGFWQIFLYGKNRFETDTAFKAMNGIGQIMLECINSIPDDKNEYQQNKVKYKNEISKYMSQLKEKLQEKYRLEAFLRKAIFEGSQVSYLTIKQDNKFHIFWHDNVIKTFIDNFTIENSKTNKEGGIPNQKVLFKINGINCGEIEMRNGESHHHKEMKFRFHKMKIFNLLVKNITASKNYSEKVIVYGGAIRKFIK